MHMTEIRTERHKVPRNGFVVAPALLERTDGEGVTKIVHARATLTGLTSQSN